ncbi:MAG TPA: CPBP family intramembrane glutamic endopeptidase [Gammaproteobacteria bacterium]|nr:CPBP family intramembrane glutamic endopeptidase [Gammaproteobacteria bacterium]
MEIRTTRPVTGFGLALAVFGIPLAVNGFRFFYGEVHSDLQFLGKELLVFGVTALLLLVVVRGEKLPLASIGLHTRAVGRSILWGLLAALLCLVAAFGINLLLHLFGAQLGHQDDNPYEPSRWLLLLTVLRAGVCEETCLRGYAIERLLSITGNKWLALGLPLALFAVFHFRLGAAGVLVALVLGAILTVFYWKRRDLLSNIIAHTLVDAVPNLLLPLFGVH